MESAIQDFYDGPFSHCYGCGASNPAGHQFKTRWVGEGTETRFVPSPDHTALPGFVYGGLVASLIDCSGTGSASWGYAREHGIDPEQQGAPRFVTGTLEVRYERPTPMGPELVCTGTIDEVKGRKVTVSLAVTAEGERVASGRVVALMAPDDMTG